MLFDEFGEEERLFGVLDKAMREELLGGGTMFGILDEAEIDKVLEGGRKIALERGGSWLWG